MLNNIKLPNVRLNVIDRIAGKIAPEWGLKRARSRMALQYLGDQGLIGPGSSKRSVRTWTPRANSADADILPKLGNLRAGARDMAYNNVIARPLLQRNLLNSIGSGLRLESRIKQKVLGLSQEQARDWQRDTEHKFNTWADSPDSDITRTLNFYDNTGLAFYSMLLSGDVFVGMPMKSSPNMPFDLRLKLIEADYCSNPNLVMDTNKLAQGVEVDSDGAPIKYHFRKPSSQYSVDLGPMASDTWTGVNVFNSLGLRQVLHLFRKERPGQRRGFPFLAPVTEALMQISRYTKAEIDAAILNSMFTVFVKHITPEAKMSAGYVPPGVGNPMGSADTQSQSDTYAGDDVNYEMGTGNIIDMMEHEAIDLADPKHPVAGFDKFTTMFTKFICASLNMPFEVVILHFASSYSAARAALNEAWKFFLYCRVYMGRYYCHPIYTMWMYEAVLKGIVSAPGFIEDPIARAAWLGSTWIGPGRGMIEPFREIKAAKEAIAGNLSTHTEEYIQMKGGDWEAAMQQRKTEEDVLTELELTSEGQTPNTSEEIPADPNKEEQEEGN